MSDKPDFPGFDMPLSIEGGAEKIPAQYRQFYEADANGALRLVDPVLKRRLDDSVIKTVLGKERQRARENERLAKGFERQLSQVATTVGAASFDELPGKMEELVGRASPSAADAVRLEIESRYKQTYSAQLAQKEAEAAKLRKSLQAKMIDGEAAAAIAALKGNVRALGPHIKQSMALRDEGGEMVARVIDQNGDIRYNERGMPMSAADLVAEYKRDPDFAMNFEGSGSTGSGARGAGGTGGAG